MNGALRACALPAEVYKQGQRPGGDHVTGACVGGGAGRSGAARSRARSRPSCGPGGRPAGRRGVLPSPARGRRSHADARSRAFSSAVNIFLM